MLLTLLLLTTGMHGQSLVHVLVDSTACMGDSVRMSVGLDAAREVQVRNVYTTVSHPEVTFLPDGRECNGSCSYRSPITFSNFTPGLTIQSANDIDFVRLNIEHSWIGDIYVGITCPNGQRAALMKYSDHGTSSCSSTIPASHRGWSTAATNAETSTYFGEPVDTEDASDRCNSSLYGNRPGTGWNYCWSNSNGNQYAPGDALIYRSANVIHVASASSYYGHSTIDSSNVRQRTNFYHPDENFSSLVGCPVNGTWYIEVLDGWSYDNGYVFDWELAMNAQLAPAGGVMTGNTVIGEGVTTVDDSTYLLSVPSVPAGNDTMVAYTVRIFGTGRTIDTVVRVHYYSDSYQLVRDTLCTGDTLRVDELVITSDYYSLDTLTAPGGCERVREIDVHFMPSYTVFDTIVLCPNETFIYENIDYTGPGDYVVSGLTAAGCDSVVYVNITDADTMFRISPFISDDGTWWSGDTTLSGCRPFRLLVRDTTMHEASRQWLFGDGAWSTDSATSHIYDTTGSFDVTLIASSIRGCHDTVVIKNAITIYQPPYAEFWWSPAKPVASHPSVQFYNESQPEDSLTYLWEITNAEGTGSDSSTLATPHYTWGDGNMAVFGKFDVLLTVYQQIVTITGDTLVCFDTAMREVEIFNDWLQFPNLVTPNGDGINDIWKVVNLLECGLYTMNELWIYNAWGALVYHARDISKEEDFWDPNETRSPDGTYYYRFSGKSLFGLVRRTGMIEVVR